MPFRKGKLIRKWYVQNLHIWVDFIRKLEYYFPFLAASISALISSRLMLATPAS